MEILLIFKIPESIIMIVCTRFKPTGQGIPGTLRNFALAKIKGKWFI